MKALTATSLTLQNQLLSKQLTRELVLSADTKTTLVEFLGTATSPFITSDWEAPTVAWTHGCTISIHNFKLRLISGMPAAGFYNLRDIAEEQEVVFLKTASGGTLPSKCLIEMNVSPDIAGGGSIRNGGIAIILAKSDINDWKEWVYLCIGNWRYEGYYWLRVNHYREQPVSAAYRPPCIVHSNPDIVWKNGSMFHIRLQWDATVFPSVARIYINNRLYCVFNTYASLERFGIGVLPAIYKYGVNITTDAQAYLLHSLRLTGLT